MGKKGQMGEKRRVELEPNVDSRFFVEIRSVSIFIQLCRQTEMFSFFALAKCRHRLLINIIAYVAACFYHFVSDTNLLLLMLLLFLLLLLLMMMTTMMKRWR